MGFRNGNAWRYGLENYVGSLIGLHLKVKTKREVVKIEKKKKNLRL